MTTCHSEAEALAAGQADAGADNHRPCIGFVRRDRSKAA
jgi:hypothetical protein